MTMIETSIIYCSSNEKTTELVNTYSATDQFAHRYLAYRDLPSIISKYTKGNYALDYGSGTGISSSFLHNLGLNVVGADMSRTMLAKARETNPHIEFYEIKNLATSSQFDLIFSSFVLFDMRSKIEIINYLKNALYYMKKNAVIILITGSEELYSPFKNWVSFDSNFEENYNLYSGKITKLRLKNPVIEFLDYFWTEMDYLECFEKAGLEVLNIHKPLGKPTDPYRWNDEILYSPFTVYVLNSIK